MGKADSCLGLRSALIDLIYRSPSSPLEHHFRNLQAPKSPSRAGSVFLETSVCLELQSAFCWGFFLRVFQTAHDQAVAVEGILLTALL